MDKQAIAEIICEIETLGFELKCLRPVAREDFEVYATKCNRLLELENKLSDSKPLVRQEIKNNKIVKFSDWKYLKKNNAV